MKAFLSDSGSGSVIKEVFWSIGKNPAVGTVDWTIGSSATVSGALALTNLTDISTATGKTVLYSTGAIMVASGNYLRGVTLTDPTSDHTSTVMVNYCTRLSK